MPFVLSSRSEIVGRKEGDKCKGEWRRWSEHRKMKGRVGVSVSKGENVDRLRGWLC